MTVREAANVDETPMIMFIGVSIVIPLIAFYMSFVDRIVAGRTQDMPYY